ncbi:MAG: hypothetical protein UX30_C0004G0008 [Candidatus Saccharibacteria bacterium GW2011_GWA2_46_10]|nr:MAG: hypothetical protein UX30_C0004G0008 [Candidatus Saccharibacteria bacterium GW2011_GWA2_46_10]
MSVVVLPFKLLQIKACIPLPDAMVSAYTLPNPCPQFIRTILGGRNFCETMELAATDETGVTLTAIGGFLLGTKCLEMEHCFFIFERVNIDLSAIAQLNAEHGRRFLQLNQAKLAIAPSTSGFVLHLTAVMYMIGEERKLFLWQSIFCNNPAEVVIEGGNQPVTVMCNFGRSVSGKIKTETQKNLGALLYFVYFRHLVNAEFLSACGAFSAAVPQSI